MKCLVFSDSHGSTYFIKQVIDMHPDAEAVFFLGDGLAEIDTLRAGYPEKFWIAVRGNCDFYSSFQGTTARKTETVRLSGYTITATHGDLYGVKSGIGGLVSLAKETDADIVLFGHTHIPFEKYISDYEKPFYLFNPGSIGNSAASFGVIELRDAPLLSHGAII